jgi:hypothetical protein
VDWTIVVSGAITAAVGIAGVTGTIIAAKIAGNSARESARLSIKAESDLARIADKRRVYARALAAVHAAASAAESAARATSDGKSGEVRSAAERRWNEAGWAVTDAMSELRLIAPGPVGDQATLILGYLNDLRYGKLSNTGLVKARDTLFNAMRIDLDEETKPGETKPGDCDRTTDVRRGSAT